VLDLADIELVEFVEKGDDAKGGTLRQFDKRAASSYLTKRFRNYGSRRRSNSIPIKLATWHTRRQRTRIARPTPMG
jgi:hypothetical protein